MKPLRFFDLITKKAFESENYQIVIKGKRKFAVAKSPSGKESWRLL